MKATLLFLTTILFFASAQAASPQFKCTIMETKYEVPTELTVIQEYGSDKAQILFNKETLNTDVKPAGNTVTYTSGNKINLTLINRGAHWGGGMTYTKPDGNTKSYPAYCSINP